ncbi:large conductance mechanosensitive channel protein MscL [Streptomyces sp. TG1A-8]|uniref:large conductance mechanosensitive channel protein MscL n=1 Tax=Streptomyces sp. TG1A-8 TaxID=3051385 RepID=UPI00265BBB8C|nr:large conductance mechanosensitive channel protein MscL [Streptomyces sp. TG1A-8]MDO0924314.1 large conductance mechanosensitive channel protein MscL [Streptomyces sp. TG1A-8]
MKDLLKGFRSFVLRGNVVDLAVGIVIGAAFTAVVNGFVRAFLTPVVGLAAGMTGEFNRKTFTVGRTVFPYGAFVDAVVSFLLVSCALYFLVVLPVNKLHERFAPHQDVQADKRDCPACLNPVPVRARRCGHCTSELQPVAGTDGTGAAQDRVRA